MASSSDGGAKPKLEPLDFMPRPSESLSDYLARAYMTVVSKRQEAKAASTPKHEAEPKAEAEDTTEIVRTGPYSMRKVLSSKSYRSLLGQNHFASSPVRNHQKIEPSFSQEISRRKVLTTKSYRERKLAAVAKAETNRDEAEANRDEAEANRDEAETLESPKKVLEVEQKSEEPEEEISPEEQEIVDNLPQEFAASYVKFMETVGETVDKGKVREAIGIGGERRKRKRRRTQHELHSPSRIVRDKRVSKLPPKLDCANCPCCVGKRLKCDIPDIPTPSTPPNGVIKHIEPHTPNSDKRFAFCPGCEKPRKVSRSEYGPVLLCKNCMEPYEIFLEEPVKTVIKYKCTSGGNNCRKCKSCWFWRCVDAVRNCTNNRAVLESCAQVVPDMEQSSPRIRYVCRRARDSPPPSPSELYLSALPSHQKQEILIQHSQLYADEVPNRKKQRTISKSNGARRSWQQYDYDLEPPLPLPSKAPRRSLPTPEPEESSRSPQSKDHQPMSLSPIKPEHQSSSGRSLRPRSKPSRFIDFLDLGDSDSPESEGEPEPEYVPEDEDYDDDFEPSPSAFEQQESRENEGSETNEPEENGEIEIDYMQISDNVELVIDVDPQELDTYGEGEHEELHCFDQQSASQAMDAFVQSLRPLSTANVFDRLEAEVKHEAEEEFLNQQQMTRTPSTLSRTSTPSMSPDLQAAALSLSPQPEAKQPENTVAEMPLSDWLERSRDLSYEGSDSSKEASVIIENVMKLRVLTAGNRIDLNKI